MIEELLVCKECNTPLIENNDGMVVCPKCGLCEERVYKSEFSKNDYKVPHYKELNKIYGTEITPRYIEFPYRLVKIDKHMKRDRKAIKMSYVIDSIFNLGSIDKKLKRDVLTLYSKYMKKNKAIPITYETFALALTQIVADIHNYHINNLETIIREMNINKGKFIKTKNRVKMLLNINVDMDRNTKYLNILNELSTKFNLNEKEKKIATKFIEKIDQIGRVNGRNPKGYIGAIVYLIGNSKDKNKRITQKELSQELGICEITLRKRVKEITKNLNKWR